MTTRLRKAAVDNGFDLEAETSEQWLGFVSTRVPLKIWLTALDEESLIVALSRADVAHELLAYGLQSVRSLPGGAVAGFNVGDFSALHHLLRRAFQLSLTLPDQLLHQFKDAVANLGRSTEAERIVVQRVGQDIFRKGLIDYWEGRCAITAFAVTELLRASHTKPWADCADDAERLDVFNGFLLAPHVDALFDKGFITVADSGEVLISPSLPSGALVQIGLTVPMFISRLMDRHRNYLAWHRAHIFRAPSAGDSGAPV